MENYTIGSTDGNPVQAEQTEIPESNTFTFTTIATPYTLVSDSEEDLKILLAYVTARTGKSLDELSTKDLMDTVGTGNYTQEMVARPGESARYHLKVGPEAIKQASSWASDYYGESPPLLSAHTSGFVGAKIDLSQTDPSLRLINTATASGFAGSAQQIYEDNYRSQAMPSLSTETIQDPELRELLANVFGDPEGGFTVGHLNVLKMMGLAEGSSAEAAGTWTVSSSGQVVSNALAQESSDFVAEENLHVFGDSKHKATIQGTDAYFDHATGGWVNQDAKVIEVAITEIEKEYGTLNEALLYETKSSAELPENITFTDDSKMLLQQLSGKLSGFKAADLNTAVVMGFMNFDRNTGSVSLTRQGKTLLGALKPEATPEDPSQQPDAANDEAFWNATNTIVNSHEGAGLKLIDHMEGQHTGKSGGLSKDGRFYGYFVTDTIAPMLEGEQPLLNENSTVWKEAGLGHLNPEQKKEVLAAVKVWSENREKLDTISEMTGSEGKEGRALTKDEASAWLARNSASWVASPVDRAKAMFEAGIQPDSKWHAYDVKSDPVKPHQNKLGELINRVLGLDINSINQQQFNQALFILETTGYVAMPRADDSTKLIRLTDSGESILKASEAPMENQEAA